MVIGCGYTDSIKVLVANLRRQYWALWPAGGFKPFKLAQKIVSLSALKVSQSLEKF